MKTSALPSPEISPSSTPTKENPPSDESLPAAENTALVTRQLVEISSPPKQAQPDSTKAITKEQLFPSPPLHVPWAPSPSSQRSPRVLWTSELPPRDPPSEVQSALAEEVKAVLSPSGTRTLTTYEDAVQGILAEIREERPHQGTYIKRAVVDIYTRPKPLQENMKMKEVSLNEPPTNPKPPQLLSPRSSHLMKFVCAKRVPQTITHLLPRQVRPDAEIKESVTRLYEEGSMQRERLQKLQQKYIQPLTTPTKLTAQDMQSHVHRMSAAEVQRRKDYHAKLRSHYLSELNETKGRVLTKPAFEEFMERNIGGYYKSLSTKLRRIESELSPHPPPHRSQTDL